MRILGTIVLMLTALHLRAQVNLVPNSSFENYTTCPTFTGNFILVQDWFESNNGSPDYYNACCILPFPSGADVPRHNFGYQYARTGNGYAAIGCYSSSSEVREYIAVELTDTLKAGQYYCVEFYISLSNFAIHAIKEFGAYLSVTNPYQSTAFNLPYTPQIKSDRLLRDTLQWMKIGGYYLASGGEKYIALGNFNNNANTIYDSIFNKSSGAYYYIDDVSVTECEPTLPPVPTPVLIQPNVFTPNNDGVNDELKFGNLPELSHLQVYNRWGNLLYEQANYQNNWRANDVSDGVYFYILKLPDGTTKHGTIHLYRNP